MSSRMVYPCESHGFRLVVSFFTQDLMSQERVVCFIDGFNLYHAIHRLKQPHLKWVNLWTLASVFLKPISQHLSAVYYFSAYADWLPQAKQRHMRYVKAISGECSDFFRIKLFFKRVFSSKKGPSSTSARKILSKNSFFTEFRSLSAKSFFRFSHPRGISETAKSIKDRNFTSYLQFIQLFQKALLYIQGEDNQFHFLDGQSQHEACLLL